MLAIVASFHGLLILVTKNLVLGPILACIGPNSIPPQKFFFVASTPTRYYTLLQANIVCNFKEN